MALETLQKATLAGGCFWCTEAVFKRLSGVRSVMPGYAGPKGDAPTYERVSTGETPFTESIQIEFDPQQISFETILKVFFATHDPTTINRQGNDAGPQYRSVVFYHDEQQKAEAEKIIAELGESGKYKNPIVTSVESYQSFFGAEDYHLGFYDKNRNYSYCTAIIDPKIKKLLAEFGDKVKEEYR